MKSRRWVLALTLVLLLLSAGLTLTWVGLDLNERLRLGTVEVLREAGCSDVRLSALRPTLVGLELQNLDFVEPGRRFRFRCGEGRFRLSLLRYLGGGADLLAALKRIELRRPVLEILQSGWRAPAESQLAAGTGDHTADLEDPDSIPLRTARFVHLLSRMPEIRLRDGRLEFIADHGEETRAYRLLDRLNGVLAPHAGRMTLLLKSQLLEGRRRGLQFMLNLDAESLDGDFSAELDSLELTASLFPALEDRVRGRLIASLELGGGLTAGRLDSLGGEGWVWLPVLQPDSLFEPLSLQTRLIVQREGLRLENGLLKWRGQQVDFHGESDFLLQRTRLDFSAAGLLLDSLLRVDGTASQAGGVLDLEGGITGSPARPRLRAKLAGRELRYGDRPAGRARALIAYEDAVFRLDSLEWNGPGAHGGPGPDARLQGTGRLRAAESAGSTRVNLDLWGLVRLRSLGGAARQFREGSRLSLRIAGELPAAGEGNPDLRLAGWTDHLAKLHWSLDGNLAVEDSMVLGLRGSIVEGNLELQGLGASAEPLCLAWMEISDPVLPWSASLNGIEGWLPRLLETAEFLPAEMRLAAVLEGRGRRVEGGLEFGFEDLRGTLEGELEPTGPGAVLRAGLRLSGPREEPLTGELELLFAERRIELRRLNLIDELEARGWTDLEAGRYLLELGADRLPVGLIRSLFTEDPVRRTGELSIGLSGEGELADFGLRGGLEYRDTAAGRRLRLRADMVLDSREFHLDRGRLSVDGADLADLELRMALDGGRGKARLEVLEIDLAELFPARAEDGPATPASIMKRPSLFGGPLEGGAGLSWSDGSPLQLNGRLRVMQPRIGGNRFERFDLRLSSDPGLAPGLLRLDSLVLRRGGDHPLDLEVAGALPIGQAAELDLEVLLSGDLLQPLSVTRSGARSSFFKRAEGSGHCEFSLAGSLLDPQLRRGSISLQRGRLDLESIFRKVRDLRLAVEIAGGRVDSLLCEARVGRERLRISNLPAGGPAVGDLESWFFETPELQLGVLVIETLDRDGDPGFVSTVIPGLMELDWDGEAELRGRSSGERFYFAGPPERPVARGRITARNTRFTYPFVKGRAESTPLLKATVAFLNSIDWDIEVLSGRNCNYYYKLQGFEDVPLFERFQGFLDRITVDVYVDTHSEGLLMTGAVEDESFRIQGEVTSHRGTVTYLEKDFKVDEAGMVFDASSLLPVVWGNASHYVLDPAQGDVFLPASFARDARQVFIHFVAEDELGNRVTRGRWDEVHLELAEERGLMDDRFHTGQEQILAELGLDPYDLEASIQGVLPGMVAGLLEIPLQPVESRIRRELGLDVVRIFLPVLRNTAEELIETQSRQESISQSYWTYLQGTRVYLGKALSDRYFASWSGQLMANNPTEDETRVDLFQRYNLEYVVNRHLTLNGELVFDPQREQTRYRGDPRLMLRYRLNY